MSRELDKVRNTERNRERNALVTADERDRTERTNYPAPWTPAGNWGSFFTFRYSSTEIFSEGGDIHVKSRETRYQDGRLTSEEYEGTLDRRAYDRVVSEAQGYFLNQVGNFVKMLYSPFSSRSGRNGE